MKKRVFVIGLALIAMTTVSCEKNKCHDCHYDDAQENEVELGQKCGDEVETLESTGYNVDGVNYEVHCHEH